LLDKTNKIEEMESNLSESGMFSFSFILFYFDSHQKNEKKIILKVNQVAKNNQSLVLANKHQKCILDSVQDEHKKIQQAILKLNFSDNFKNENSSDSI